MATLTRNPTSDILSSATPPGVSATGWSGAEGSRWTIVDNYPDTGGTDITTLNNAAGGFISFAFSVFTLPATASAISVQVLYYDRKNASQACNVGADLRIGTTPTHHAQGAGHNPTNATIVSRTDDYGLTNPKSAAAWTVNDVNGVSVNRIVGFGVTSNDASPTIDLTSIQLQVTYTDADPAEVCMMVSRMSGMG